MKNCTLCGGPINSPLIFQYPSYSKMQRFQFAINSSEIFGDKEVCSNCNQLYIRNYLNCNKIIGKKGSPLKLLSTIENVFSFIQKRESKPSTFFSFINEEFHQFDLSDPKYPELIDDAINSEFEYIRKLFAEYVDCFYNHNETFLLKKLEHTIRLNKGMKKEVGIFGLAKVYGFLYGNTKNIKVNKKSTRDYTREDVIIELWERNVYYDPYSLWFNPPEEIIKKYTLDSFKELSNSEITTISIL